MIKDIKNTIDMVIEFCGLEEGIKQKFQEILNTFPPNPLENLDGVEDINALKDFEASKAYKAQKAQKALKDFKEKAFITPNLINQLINTFMSRSSSVDKHPKVKGVPEILAKTLEKLLNFLSFEIKIFAEMVKRHTPAHEHFYCLIAEKCLMSETIDKSATPQESEPKVSDSQPIYDKCEKEKEVYVSGFIAALSASYNNCKGWLNFQKDAIAQPGAFKKQQAFKKIVKTLFGQESTLFSASNGDEVANPENGELKFLECLFSLAFHYKKALHLIKVKE